MIKLIVSDLDGTLLNQYQQISDYTVHILHECMNHGVEFMMATGRDYLMVYEYIEQYDLSCDMILNNGAQYKTKDLKRNNYFPIEHDKLREVVSILQKYDYEISIHTTNGKYIFDDPNSYYDKHIAMIKKEHGNIDLTPFMQSAFFRRDGFLKGTTQIDSVEEMFDQGVEALKLDCKNPDINKGMQAMEELRRVDHILLSSSYASYVEITSDKTHKGKLLQRICEEKNYKEEEVAVFGDGTNDIGLLSLFSNSYAPSNACEEVKEIVKEIIPSNNEDGVAIKLVELLKEENGVIL